MGSVWRSTAFLFKGTREFTRSGYEQAAKSFDDTVTARDLKGHHCLITGANQGVGYQIAEDLARKGATVTLACRNPDKGKEAVEKVKAASGNSDVHLTICDVSSLESIKKMAQEYSADGGKPLHLLVNNAGIMSFQGRQTSADGFELSFATNTLGAFALTRLLEPALKKSAPSRVIFMSSGGMYTERLEIDDMQAEKVKKYDATTQYAKDKRRLVALAEEFARQWQGSGVEAYSMHPGWTTTQGVTDAMPGFTKTFGSRMRTLPQGADTALYLALQDSAKLEPGGFYLDRKPQEKHLWGAGTRYSQADVDKLWATLSKMAGLQA